jgi:hypothetical protein
VSQVRVLPPALVFRIIKRFRGILSPFILRPCVNCASSVLLQEGRELVCGVVAWDVVRVDHRGLNVCVAHEGLDIGEGERLDRERPERVAQIVEAHSWKLGGVESVVEAPTQGALLDVAADRGNEYEVGLIGEVLAPAQLV